MIAVLDKREALASQLMVTFAIPLPFLGDSRTHESAHDAFHVPLLVTRIEKFPPAADIVWVVLSISSIGLAPARVIVKTIGVIPAAVKVTFAVSDMICGLADTEILAIPLPTPLGFSTTAQFWSELTLQAVFELMAIETRPP